MKYVALPVLAGLMAWAGAIHGALADAPPKSWSKSMTSDPATNHALERFTRPLPDHAQETVRTIMLFRLLSTGCVGVKANRKLLDVFTRGSGFFSLSTEDAKVASRFGSAQFDALDYQDLAHLCAGSDYLFGPRGVLVKGAMTKGDGRLRFPYDAANPYVPVRPFLPD